MSAGTMGDGRAVPDVPGGRTLTLRLDRVNTASRSARAFLRAQLPDVDSESLETGLLVATELVTNAVLHADGPIDLTVTVSPARLVIQVFDCEPLPPLLRDQNVSRTDGRGIALVSMVCADWGTRHHNGGKTVWGAIDRPTADVDGTA